jgi:hypothetical protein
MDDEGDGGQIMLLTAVLLVAGLLAITLLGARTTRVANVTSALASDPLPDETTALRAGLTHAIQALEAIGAPDYTTTNVDAALLHFRHLESSRGFLMQASLAGCAPAGSGMAVTIQFELAGAASAVSERLDVAVTGCPV